jgi:hypothetical protein
MEVGTMREKKRRLTVKPNDFFDTWGDEFNALDEKEKRFYELLNIEKGYDKYQMPEVMRALASLWHRMSGLIGAADDWRELSSLSDFCRYLYRHEIGELNDTLKAHHLYFKELAEKVREEHGE